MLRGAIENSPIFCDSSIADSVVVEASGVQLAGRSVVLMGHNPPRRERHGHDTRNPATALSGKSGNPAIFGAVLSTRETGDFASPPSDGFALFPTDPSQDYPNVILASSIRIEPVRTARG